MSHASSEFRWRRGVVSIGLPQFAAIAAVKGIVLAVNDWRCPLTSLTSRHADECRENSAICRGLAGQAQQALPRVLYIAGVADGIAQWMRA